MDNGSVSRPRRIGTGDFVEGYLLYLLARVSHVLSSEFHQQLRRRSVAVPVWRVLASLSGSRGETVTGLAEVCLLQQPTMTKLLDRMVRDGLVTRSQDARDRRVVRVALTQQGEALAAELIAAARQHEAGVLARFPEMETLDLKAVLRSVLEREADPPPSKWSVSRYGFEPEEDRDGEEGAQARGDRGQAAAGGRAGLAGPERG